MARREAAHTLILLLGARTGWTLSEIKALPKAEFEFYTNTLIELSKPKTHV